MDECFQCRSNTNILFLGGAKRVSMTEQLVKAGIEMGRVVLIFRHGINEGVQIASTGDV